MPDTLSISLHNDMHERHFFKVVDNISGKTLLECDLKEDRTVQIAPGISGEGDISYTPRNSLTIRKIGLDDGDTVDMN